MRNTVSLFFLILFVISSNISCAQVAVPTYRPHVENKAFDEKISSTISFTVPVISPEELKQLDEAQVFDTRKQKEYDISHIPNAQYLGYNDFDISRLDNIDKDSPIVLYCSIGYRSEKIGEKLKKEGFTNVYNLYGSIFEWVNQGNEVVDKNGKTTSQVHTYNRNWSQWVDETKAEKIW